MVTSIRTDKTLHHSQALNSLDLFWNVLITVLLKSLFHSEQSSQDVHQQYLRLQVPLSLLHHSLLTFFSVFFCLNVLVYVSSSSQLFLTHLMSWISHLSLVIHVACSFIFHTSYASSLFSVSLSFLLIFSFVVTQTPEPQHWDLTLSVLTISETLWILPANKGTNVCIFTLSYLKCFQQYSCLWASSLVASTIRLNIDSKSKLWIKHYLCAQQSCTQLVEMT